MIRAKCYSVALSIWSATFLTWHSFSEAAYPERAVRIIVAYGVGGGADLVARVVGGKLSEKWGKPVVIENRTGANGTIGLAAVVGATPDGHTLALYTSTHPIAPYLYKLNYDPITGIKPVSLLAAQPDVFVVNTSLPVRSLQELISLARSKPGQLNYGSAGAAIPGALNIELLKKKAGIDIVQIIYRDGTPVDALLRGDIQMINTTMSILLPQVNAGKFRALAVSGKQRVAALPSVPTLAEATGLEGFDFGGIWYGIAAPRATSDGIVNKIHADLVAVTSLPDVQETLAKLGVQVIVNTPKEFDNLIKQESANWGAVINSIGIRPQ